MTASDAIRWLHYQASLCRSQDQHEALCLLLPALLRTLELQPMSERQAWAFRLELKEQLNHQTKEPATRLAQTSVR